MQSTPSSTCRSGCQSPRESSSNSTSTEFLTGGVRLYISAMDCPTEERMIRAKLESMPEVNGLAFNLLERILTVKPASSDSLSAVIDALTAIGFPPELLAVGQATAVVPEASYLKGYGRLALGGLCALLAEVLHFMAVKPEWIILVVALLAVFFSGFATYKKGWIALKHLDFNINALMAIAVTGAMLIGEWPEAAMVMVLFTLAEVIESKSLERARNAIRKLMALAPDNAMVKDPNGGWVECAVSEVQVGQVVRIRPGEKIPLDGEIISGSGPSIRPLSPVRVCRWKKPWGTRRSPGR